MKLVIRTVNIIIRATTYVSTVITITMIIIFTTVTTKISTTNIGDTIVIVIITNTRNSTTVDRYVNKKSLEHDLDTF